MKTLFLLRHAKSSWQDAGQLDFERPLNERGVKAATLIGAFISKQNLQPDSILCSPAQRTRETLALVSKAAKLTTPPRFDERLYEAGVNTLLEIVSQIDEKADTVLLIGHNPGITELIFSLTGESRDVPTGTLACIALDTEKWSKTRANCGKLELFVKPKELGIG
jgi:phosphohistidine phosphatase